MPQSQREKRRFIVRLDTVSVAWGEADKDREAEAVVVGLVVVPVQGSP